MIRVGLVGAGLHSLAHLEGYQGSRNVDLTAVCDVVPGRAEAIAEKFGIPNVCASLEDMAAKRLVDLVDIVTPPLSHRAVVGSALELGLHVICEKPLAIAVAEAEEMCVLADDVGVRAFTSFQRRYDPVMIHVHNLLRDGFIGDVVLSTASVIVDWGKLKATSQAQGFRQWISQTATGGGFIAGALPHYVDLVRYLLGDVASLVSQSGPAGKPLPAGRHDDRPDDTVIVAGMLAAGGMFTVAATWAAENPTNERWEIVGSRRTLIIEADGRLLATTGSGLEELDVPAPLAVCREQHINRGFGFGNAGPGFGALVSDVCASLEDGGQPYCATFADGLRSAEIIAQLQCNAARG